MNTPTLAELITRFLEPIRGKDAQSALCRHMNTALKIGPDSVKGFLTIIKVRAVISEALCKRLIVESGVQVGDVITHHPRRVHWTHKGADVYGWEPEGRKCTVTGINRHNLSLYDHMGVHLKSTVPLYCTELLAKVGATIDFAELDAKAKAIADATRKP